MTRVQRQIPRNQILNDDFIAEPLHLSEAQVKSLLSKLCIDLGYCLEPTSYSRIVNAPATNPASFARMVMELDGVWSEASDMFQPVFRLTLTFFLQAKENDAQQITGPVSKKGFYAVHSSKEQTK